MTRSHFQDNVAIAGGVYGLVNSSLYSSNSFYIGNTASNSAARSRFSLPDRYLFPCLDGCTFVGQCLDASASAGAIIAVNSHVAMSVDNFIGNMGQVVGLLHLDNGTLNIYNSNFRNNSATVASVLMTQTSNATMVNCTFKQNQGRGGTILFGGYADVYNSTFVQNSGVSSSCITISPGKLVVSGCHFAGNNAVFKCSYLGACGSVIFADGLSSVSVSDSDFTHNTLCLSGQAASSFSLSRLIFTDNRYHMGVIMSSVNLSDSSLSQGQLLAIDSKVHVSNCSFSEMKEVLLTGSDVLFRDTFVGNFDTRRFGFVMSESNLTMDHSVLILNKSKSEFVRINFQLHEHSNVTFRRAKVMDKSSSLLNFGSRFLYASRSSVQVEHSEFLDSSPEYLFEMRNGSTLYIRDSQFLRNQLLLSLFTKSKASFEKCLVANNSHTFLSVLQSLRQLTNNSFSTDTNSLVNYNYILSSSRSGITVHNSQVEEKNTFLFAFKSKVQFFNTTFLRNWIPQLDLPPSLPILHIVDSLTEISHSQLLFRIYQPQYMCAPILIFEKGAAFLDRCTLSSQVMDSFEPLCHLYVDVEKTDFKMASTHFNNFLMRYEKGKETTKLLSWNTSFVTNNFSSSSLNNPQFPQDAISSGFLSKRTLWMSNESITPSDIIETQYASGTNHRQTQTVCQVNSHSFVFLVFFC